MSLQTNLAALITQLGTDWKAIWAKIGSGTLNTSATNIIAAINEVKTTADAAVEGSVPDASTTVAGKVELATDSEALAMSATDVVVTPGNLGAIANVNNGFAKLDGSGKILASQIPGSIEEVLEFANLAAFPGTGTTSKLYVALDTNKVYRWSGSAYVEISASPGSTDAVTEGTTNLYFTNTRADARITALVGNTDIDLAAAYATAKA